ncbi:carboxyl transferase domain-containing protein [Nocardia africana]|uniref:Carboxyl transferase domain-containing protein n=1 Tax=Nocardia africana TaxID=134964 RepID=A0ABW6NU42_9NOCA
MQQMKKLLVANRGEIAVRILSTAAALGIPTVAIHPDDDAACAHVARAGEAIRLPGAGPAAYLAINEIVAAAVRTGCDALHPGYGFLSENPALAEACAESGITFVGPSQEALALFGDKSAARARARALNIPVLTGTEGATDLAEARAFFGGLGPGGAVMVKALAGGGGRGMRPVTRAEELEEALRRCASEAAAAFGDPAVYVERLLPRARHVEVQVLGDGLDTVVLGDRDCSAQRRRQKLVELAPAPGLPEAVRIRLHEAATRLVTDYCGLATVEFLVDGDEIAFLEVNPRIQVEHTVTEEVTGLDLVELGLQVARGARLDELGLSVPPPARGAAVQARVNAETIAEDGTVSPGIGTLIRFQPPTGRGVRVDTHGYVGWTVGPRYDSLLAKVVVTGTDASAAAARAGRALAEFDLAGVPVNFAVLQALLERPELAAGTLHTTFVDDHLAELLDRPRSAVVPLVPDEAQSAAVPRMDTPAGTDAVRSPQQGVVVAVLVNEGDLVATGTEIMVLEAMKMEHVVRADQGGRVETLAVKVGDTVDIGTPLAFLAGSAEAEDIAAADVEAHDPDWIRPDLAEVLERHRLTLDEARPTAVERMRSRGRRTARENLADLVDAGSFVEYGALTIAAQRRRRSLQDLIERTPADGLITGTGTIGGLPVAVMIYDSTVLAGTQGMHNHAKSDRLFELAARERLPIVIFAEGGGGRPGDTDYPTVAGMHLPSFKLLAGLRGRVPTLAVVSGYCFAGNAAFAAPCDTIIATEGSNLGMGGPAVIEGGGLGVFAPGDIGPMDVQWANGVVDRLVPDDRAAVADARRWISYFDGREGAADDAHHADQRVLRHLIPENRLRVYGIRRVVDVLFDTGSVLELRGGFGIGVVTAFARLNGRAVGVLANNPEHLGGAIDGDAADKATAFLELCETHRLPVVVLVDTPGFMVGPDAERTATVRRFGALFVAGARLTVPFVAVVLRKAYGLGGQAMIGGSLHAPVATFSWPTGEFGGMGIDGAVQLGFKVELESIDDPEARQARYDELVAGYYERGKALNMASVFEGIDDVIDPADTRRVLWRALQNTGRGQRR